MKRKRNSHARYLIALIVVSISVSTAIATMMDGGSKISILSDIEIKIGDLKK